MNSPAEQLNVEPTPPEGAPPVELSDEDMFEQAFDERFGDGETPPETPPAGEAETPPPAGDEPPPSQQAGSETPPAGEEPPPPANAEPEWFKDLPDEAKETFAALNNDLGSVREQYTALHGRLAPIQQQNADLQRRLQDSARTPKPTQAAPAGQTPASGSTPALDLSQVPEFVEFEATFPEEAKAISAIFSRQAQHLDHLSAQLGEVSQGLQEVQTVSSGDRRERELNNLATAHPDWMQVRPSVDFKNWLTTQPASVARMADSPNSNECIYVLDRYKQDVYMQRELAKRDNPPPATTPESGSAPHAVRTHRQQLRSVPSLDPQAPDVGVPQGNPEAMMNEEDIWAQEVERRLRAQRNNQR